MKSLSIYIAYFVQFLKSRMAYKKDFFAGIFANLLTTFSGLLFVVLLIDGKIVPSLKGWRREEVLFIYGYSMVSMAFFSTFSINLYGFGKRYIIQGEFDRILLRLLDSMCQVLFESFNLDVIGSLSLGIILLVYTGLELDMTFSLIDYVWLIFSAFCGGIIVISVFIILTSFSFHFEDKVGIIPPFYSLINFSRYPLPIFNDIIQFILSWCVPFAFVSFYPATHFFERTGFEFLCYFTPMMSIVCFLMALFSWRFGVSKYSSTGN